MKRILLSALGVVALTAAVWADPPATVGRLSYLDGSVSFSSAAGGQWQPATLNYPLTSGNMLSTGRGARAEIEIGSAVVLLASDTAMTFETLDGRSVQIRLDRGLMSIRLRPGGRGGDFLVDTQTASISLAAPGRYRIDQRQSGDASVIAWEGDAQVTGGQAAFDVRSGQAADIPASGPDASLVAIAPPPDAWDRWVAERYSREDEVASERYVSSQMEGAADLGEYGNWTVVAGYGPVWIPDAVPVGWAPYTLGQWVWIAPWGWTWVDDEPWGFAPFHYGRWVMYTGEWCWVPGPIVAHPVYAPALVRWVGGMPGPGRPPVAGQIRWVPLQPRQVYHPLYRTSTTYFRAVNGIGVYRPRAAFGPGIVARGPFSPGRPGLVSRPPWVAGGPGLAPRGPVQPERPFVPRGAPQYGRPGMAAGPPGHVMRQWPPPQQASGGRDPWLLNRRER